MPHSTTIDAMRDETSVNVDAVSAENAQFSAHRPRDHPAETSGHKPGVKASPADHAEEFHAKTLPPGSAPPERTFQPQNLEARARGAGEEVLPTGTEGMPGATSADVHTGLGHPGQGMTSTELRHDGQQGRKKAGDGLAKFGAAGEQRGADARLDEGQRDLENEATGRTKGRGNKGELAAEDLPPASA